MKAKYPIMVVFVAIFVMSGLAFAKPVKIIKPEIYFDVPSEVLRITEINPKTLPPELLAPSAITYTSMKEEVNVKMRTAFGPSVLNYTGRDILITVNGKQAYFKREGKRVGLCIIGQREMPIPLSWFEEYGDGNVLVIGMFPLGPGNSISEGAACAFTFSDLIDSGGNLRKLKFGIKEAMPLSQIRVGYIRPNYGNLAVSPIMPLKPGAKPLVIKTAPMLTIPNVGPVVEMPTFLVKATDEQATVAMAKWMRLDLTIEKGEVIRREVLSVAEGSPYADAGLKPGMFIWTISAPEIDPAFAGSVWPYRDIELVVTDSAAVASRLVLSAERIRHALSAQMGKTLAATP